MEHSIGLSIIVPIYNAEKYLDECVQSILRQTYSNTEIILVDDGSEGHEAEICNRYALEDSRVKVIRKENGGAVSARIEGIKVANGQYIGFVDADDYIAPEYYERIMSVTFDYAVDIVSTAYTEVEKDKEFTRVNLAGDGLYSYSRVTEVLKRMNCSGKYYNMGINPALWNKVFKAEILKKYCVDVPLNLRMGDDAAMTFPAILKCNSIYLDNQNNGYYYRQLEESLSRTWRSTYFDEVSILYRYLFPFYQSKGDVEISKQLELYRVFLIELGLRHYVRGLPSSERNNLFHKIVNSIRRGEQKEYAIFTNIDVRVLDNVATGIRKDILALQEGHWIRLGLRYKLLQLRETVS